MKKKIIDLKAAEVVKLMNWPHQVVYVGQWDETGRIFVQFETRNESGDLIEGLYMDAPPDSEVEILEDLELLAILDTRPQP
jgi:hypothetical protein